MYSHADASTDAESLTPVAVFTGLSPIDRAVTYVHQHYRWPAISLADVARAAGLSRFHLARQLKRLTRRSFLQHVHALRIGEAERLLQWSALSVKEVAAHVGYNDSTQFCRQFRRAHGISPGAFRRRARARIADEQQRSPTLRA